MRKACKTHIQSREITEIPNDQKLHISESKMKMYNWHKTFIWNKPIKKLSLKRVVISQKTCLIKLPPNTSKKNTSFEWWTTKVQHPYLMNKVQSQLDMVTLLQNDELWAASMLLQILMYNWTNDWTGPIPTNSHKSKQLSTMWARSMNFTLLLQ